MVLFGKREVVFKTVGDSDRWKKARQALKSAGIRIMEASSYENEITTCGCGAKLDQRNYGPYGWIDRRVYYVSVSPADIERARIVLLDAVGSPLVSDKLVLPDKKAR